MRCRGVERRSSSTSAASASSRLLKMRTTFSTVLILPPIRSFLKFGDADEILARADICGARLECCTTARRVPTIDIAARVKMGLKMGSVPFPGKSLRQRGLPVFSIRRKALNKQEGERKLANANGALVSLSHQASQSQSQKSKKSVKSQKSKSQKSKSQKSQKSQWGLSLFEGKC